MLNEFTLVSAIPPLIDRALPQSLDNDLPLLKVDLAVVPIFRAWLELIIHPHIRHWPCEGEICESLSFLS